VYKTQGQLLGYQPLEDGSYRIYPDGREVCVDLCWPARVPQASRAHVEPPGVEVLFMREADPIAR